MTIEPNGENGVKISEDFIGRTTDKPVHVPSRSLSGFTHVGRRDEE